MNATIVVVLILPILVVSLLVTVNTVFRTLKQWFPHFASQFFVITFLYFVYLYILLALSIYLLGEIIYEYTLALFIAHYFFKRVGKVLLVLTPFFMIFSVETSAILMDTPTKNILLIGISQFVLYLLVTQTPLRKKEWVFDLLFVLTTLISIQFRWDDIQVLQGKTPADIRVLGMLGSLFIVLVFNSYYSRREREVRNHREIILQSKKDLLTGAYNFTALNEVVELLETESQKVVVAMVDLDWFKKVNDEHGHLEGNTVLKDFVHLMRQQLLTKMSQLQFEIYRFGGEEFCLFFYDIPQEEVFQALDDFRSNLENEGIIIDGGLKIDQTFSAGIEVNDDYGKELLTTIARADAACYYSKQLGRNQITLYEKMDHKT